MKALIEVIRINSDIITTSAACPGQCGTGDNAGSGTGCDGDD